MAFGRLLPITMPLRDRSLLAESCYLHVENPINPIADFYRIAGFRFLPLLGIVVIQF